MIEPTYGDTVRVNLNAKPEQRPGMLSSICGLRKVETDEQAQKFECPIGTTLYLVEFGDGAAMELPASMVELVRDEFTK